MAFQHNPGFGALFKNTFATDATHPGYKGQIAAHRDIKAGEVLDIAAWLKDGQQGKFFSLKLSDPYQAAAEPSVDDDPDFPF